MSALAANIHLLSNTTVISNNDVATSTTSKTSMPIMLTASKALSANLDDIYKNCSNSNWDGYGATPIKKDVIALAKELFTHIPSYCLPYAEVAPEPV